MIDARWRKALARGAVYAGFNPLEFLRADSIERMLLLELLEQMIDEGIERDHHLANRIIWELSEAMKKK